MSTSPQDAEDRRERPDAAALHSAAPEAPKSGPRKGSADGTWEACDQKQFGKRNLQDAKMEDYIDIMYGYVM